MEIENEIWKPIIIEKNGVLYDFTGLYEVSNLGRVRSLNYRHTDKVKVLAPTPDKQGYLKIGLCKNGKRINCLVHRLVATAFIDNVNNLPEVNHKDENKENNNIENLEWCDRKYNAQYSLKGKKATEETREKMSRSKHSRFKRVLCVETQQVFNGLRDACDWLRVDYKAASNICACCRGKQKTAYGYHWQYV